MHSSRMRTGRSLTVWCSQLPGGVSAWSGGGGVCLVGGGVCLVPGGVGVVSAWSGEVGVCLVWGGWCLLSQHALRQTPPVNRMNERQV